MNLRRKKFWDFIILSPQNGRKTQNYVEAQKAMCPMLPDPNFLVSEVELPKEKHIKNPEPRILLLRRKVHFSVFPRRMKTQKLTFLRNIKIRGSGFLICFSLGNSTSLTKKLGLGNIGHMDFWDITLF